MRNIVLFTCLVVLFSCGNETNSSDGCECYKNHYINNKIQSSEFYSTDCSDDNKIIFNNDVQKIKIECK